MKLICEVLDQKLSLVKEAREDGKKQFHIEGVFLMGDRPNKNGRIYESKILAKEVARYTKDLIETNRAYGELGHPEGPSINLDRVSHMIKELKIQGNQVVGRAKIMETPMGNIVRNLISEGARLGVSSRGMGSLVEKNGIMEVQNDFHLATAGDIVADPSAPNAFVNGIMEGVEWIWNNGIVKPQKLEDIKQSINESAKKRTLEKDQFKIFEQFINSLSKK
jgi:hypothetical protein